MMRVLLWSVVLLTASVAGADERILSYDSRIEVRSDSSLEVTETIRVRAKGNRIKRGIFRELPTTYFRRGGDRVTVGDWEFEVESVDGKRIARLLAWPREDPSDAGGTDR